MKKIAPLVLAVTACSVAANEIVSTDEAQLAEDVAPCTKLDLVSGSFGSDTKVSSLEIADNSGTEKKKGTYVKFYAKTEAICHMTLPKAANPPSSLTLKVNYLGPELKRTEWPFHVYDHTANAWVKVTNNAFANSWSWTGASVALPAPVGRFIKDGRVQMKYGIRSSTENSYLDQWVLLAGGGATAPDAGTTNPVDGGTGTDSGTKPPSGKAKAFPTAEGWGTETIGGRGGTICAVTNLNDTGTGSFRDCVTRSGPRIVIFKVSGTITTNSLIEVRNPNLTVLGQTSPGGGITLRANGHRKDILKIGANDVILRYVRFRHGTPIETNVNSASNVNVGTSENSVSRVVIDHCSFSWAVDGNLETYFNTREVTISWNLLTEPLVNSAHAEGEHGKSMHLSGAGAGRFSVHHNLLANGNDRNPAPNGLDDYDIRNNVIYNWGKKATYISTSRGYPYGNFVNNFYKRGPNTKWAYEIAHYDGDLGPVHKTYVKGNIGPNRPNDTLPENYIVRPEDRGDLVSTPYSVPAVTTTSAFQAYTDVLAGAGASFPYRDPVDARAVAQTKNNTGAYIDHEKEVGGYPSLPAGTPPTDTDGDGVPDAFEIAHGTNPNVADSTGDRDGNGYSNVEDWANSLIGEY